MYIDHIYDHIIEKSNVDGWSYPDVSVFSSGEDFRAELTAVQGRGGHTGEHVQGVLNLLDNLDEDL